MSRSSLDALLGRQFDNGTELELLGGMNWIGFTITRDDANNRYNFALASAGALTVTTINGAAPLAPVEGTVLADASANILATEGSQRRIPTLTANRTYDINNTGAIDEESITLYRTGTEAFTATIRDNADATIATFPASTKLAGVFRKATGANFVFVGFYRLA